jgi:catechol 2,3-dioxygenase-like lactoylglutathione lyase family enzyme
MTEAAQTTGVTVDGIVHWGIEVNDLAESVAFYTQILGLKDVGPLAGGGIHCLSLGNIQVLLCKMRTPRDPSAPRNSALHHAFSLSSEMFDYAEAHLREWGVNVQTPTAGPWARIEGDVEHRPGNLMPGRSIYFHDPSGNRLEINDPTPGS